MNYRCLFTIFAVAVPLVAGNYGPPSPSYLQSSGGLSEIINSAAGGSQQEASTLTAAAEAQPTPAEAARLNAIRAQLNILNSNPTYQNLRNSESIAESVAENNLANKIRTGNINLVAPNVVNQGVFRSLLVPSGPNNHQVIATQPLPSIIVNQPGAPPAQVTSGPAAIVKAAPVIYKLRPSVVIQQEVINKVPTPLSINPVYVKVFKPAKKIVVPYGPVVQPSYDHAAPSYANSNAAAASDSYSSAGSAPSYANAAPYSAPASYAPAQPEYAPAQPAYAPAQSSYAPASY